jgi:hypothetical protein
MAAHSALAPILRDAPLHRRAAYQRRAGALLRMRTEIVATFAEQALPAAENETRDESLTQFRRRVLQRRGAAVVTAGQRTNNKEK